MKKEIICTVCPRGCHIQAGGEGKTVTKVEGFSCKRGKEYAAAEFVCPARILTTTVKLEGVAGDLLPVRSNKPLPKDKLFVCMDAIRTAQVKTPVRCYDVIVSDICGTGANMVAAKIVL